MFGIDSQGIGLALNLLVIFLIAIWFALIYWTLSDARRRLTDPVLVASAVIAAAVFPFAGAMIYAIVRPPETLEDAYERDLDVRAAELRVRLLEHAVKSGSSGSGFAATVAGELAGETAVRRPAAQSSAKPAAPRRAESPKSSAQPKPADESQASRPAGGVPTRPSQSQRTSSGSPVRRPPASGADGA